MLSRFVVRSLLFSIANLVICVSSGSQEVTPKTSAGGFADVDGVKLWYQECGGKTVSAPNVVLLHDGLLHSITWDRVWPLLCDKYHVVRYDRRGYGQSEPAKASFSAENDLLQIMRQVHMSRAIIMGNSSGGGLALDFALAHPDMVEALVLIGPVVHGMASSDYFLDRGEQNNEPMARGDLKAVAENWSRDRFLLAGDDKKARTFLYEGLVHNPQNLKNPAMLEMRSSPPTVSRLSDIWVPTLVLVGDADIADVFAYSGAIEAEVPLAIFEVWKGTGHLIQLQKPKELADRFNQFVPKVERKYVMLSAGQLNAYVGKYKIGNYTAAVFLNKTHLSLEIAGGPIRWLFAASETMFFLQTGNPEIEFKKDTEGKVVEMAIHNSDGSIIRCPRMDAADTNN